MGDTSKMYLCFSTSCCGFCHILNNLEIKHFALIKICFKEFAEFVKNNIDSTVIIEKPILRPFIDLMCETIAFHLEIEKELVNIKATRGEKLGFVGEGLGVEAESIVLLRRI